MRIGVYLPARSRIQKVDLRARMLIFLLILPAVTVLASAPVLVGLMILIFLLLKISEINLRAFWKDARYYVVFSFVTFLAISMIEYSGKHWLRLFNGFLLGARFTTFISFGMIYAATTNPNEIPQALMKLHIPHRFGVLIMVGFRLYPLILQRLTTITEAIRARGIDVRVSVSQPVKSIRAIKLLFVPLVIATLETGARLGDTMASRGYNPYMPITISPRLRFKPLDWACLVIVLALLGLAIWI